MQRLHAPCAERPRQLGFEQRVSEFTLPNGLHFVLLERHTAPVVSCHTHANVGAFVEEDGRTGIAVYPVANKQTIVCCVLLFVLSESSQNM